MRLPCHGPAQAADRRLQPACSRRVLRSWPPRTLRPLSESPVAVSRTWNPPVTDMNWERYIVTSRPRRAPGSLTPVTLGCQWVAPGPSETLCRAGERANIQDDL